jgi:hypothetical protein
MDLTNRSMGSRNLNFRFHRYHRAFLYVLLDDAMRTDEYIVADADVTEDSSEGADLYTVAQCRMPLVRRISRDPCRTQRNAA